MTIFICLLREKLKMITPSIYRGKNVEIRKYPDGKTKYFIDDREVRLAIKDKKAIGQ